MSSVLIQPLSDTYDERSTLRILLGMLVKRRTADADILDISFEQLSDFRNRFTVGVTVDRIAGKYTVVVCPKEQPCQTLTVMPDTPASPVS